MKIDKVYKTLMAEGLLVRNPLLKQAYEEVIESICSVTWPMGASTFTINNTEKNVNGVTSIKENCYIVLENKYLWYREKPLKVFESEKQKGGPIDVYKEFVSSSGDINLRIGLEFETGNVASAHRSMNKLLLGLNRNEIDLAIILFPVKELSYYLTDRVSNYEELEPYFEITDHSPFVFIGFNADAYDAKVPIIPKGAQGMSNRSVRKWVNP